MAYAPRTEKHDVTEECQGIHCESHNLDEAGPGQPYHVCYECGHRFATKEDLAEDYNWEAYTSAVWFSELRGTYAQFPRVEPDKVHHCPHCLHSF